MEKNPIKWCGKVKWNLKKVKQRKWIGRKSKVLTICAGRVRVTLQYRRFAGIAVLGIARAPQLGAPFETVRRMEFPDVKKRKPVGEQPLARSVASLEPGPLAPVSPLIEHIALLQYDEGEPRKPGKFFCEVQGAAFKVTVKDIDTDAQFTAVGPTLWAALEAAALYLSCDDAPWEPDVWALERKKKSKK